MIRARSLVVGARERTAAPVVRRPGRTPYDEHPPATVCAPGGDNPTSVTFGFTEFGVQMLAPGSWTTDALMWIANTVA